MSSPGAPSPESPAFPPGTSVTGAAAADPVIDSPWQGLRRHTRARIALGRAGHSLPTEPLLAFRLAHAQARDAVHLPFESEALVQRLQRDLGWPAWRLRSGAADRRTYLQRPDLGRRLDEASRERLTRATAEARAGSEARFDLAFVVADGLSALAAHRHAVPLLAAIRERLEADRRPWRLAPVAVVDQGRVAVADDVAEALDARCVVILLGERPGLSSPDSLGVYLTWAARRGFTDERRNCISNVRPEGLPIDAAAGKLLYLLQRARDENQSGVGLKDEAEPPPPAIGLRAGRSDLPGPAAGAAFLLGPA